MSIRGERLGRLKKRQFKSVIAAVDTDQTEDLMHFPKHPELKPGLTVRGQLALIARGRHSQESMSGISEGEEESISRCNLREFLSQPLRQSAVTHTIGRVVRTNRTVMDATPYRGLRTSIEIQVSSSGVPFLVPSVLEGRVDFKLPHRGDLIHVCGVMMFLPSFSTYRLVSPVNARVSQIWKCPGFQSEKLSIWGLVDLELDSEIVNPTCIAYNTFERR